MDKGYKAKLEFLCKHNEEKYKTPYHLITILIICGISLILSVIGFACLMRYIARELSRRDYAPRDEISHILRQIDNMEAREAKKKELIESMIANM